MGMLQDSGGRFGVAAPHLVGHFGAMREAFAGGFSTAHWHACAWESLLPGSFRLPSTVAACMPGHTQHNCTHQSKDWLPAHVMSGIAAQCDTCPHEGSRWTLMVADMCAGMNSGRLPAHMLFSDRDFDENDYEALLALDEGIENRKGAACL